jgi:hypothetical protein
MQCCAVYPPGLFNAVGYCMNGSKSMARMLRSEVAREVQGAADTVCSSQHCQLLYRAGYTRELCLPQASTAVSVHSNAPSLRLPQTPHTTVTPSLACPTMPTAAGSHNRTTVGDSSQAALLDQLIFISLSHT